MKQSRQENLIYLIVWGMLFAAPLLGLYVTTTNEPDLTFHWADVFFVWRKFAWFFLLFIIHDILLAPLLVHKHKTILYYTITAAIVVIFSILQFKNRPHHEGDQRGIQEQVLFAPDNQHIDDFPGPPHGSHERGDFPGPPPGNHEIGNHPGPAPRDPERNDSLSPVPGNRRTNTAGNAYKTPSLTEPFVREPPLISEPDIMATLLLIFMFVANIGLKIYYRSRDERHRLEELERENLEHQLEYLRFQINPHFFMNTLNNIHALIDIDTAKAQTTIVELSKMMRYVLYEGDRKGVPLTKEMEFIRTYVSLMRLRYADIVEITLDLPTGVPERSIPPLVLVSFIENAFKHGISYQHKSFVEIRVTVEEERLLFYCHNSKADVANPEKGGVGLENVRKRLDLLYPDSYELTIRDEADTYTVELNIPTS